MSKGNEFVKAVVPTEYDKFIDDCHKNIVKSEPFCSTIEDGEIEEESSDIYCKKEKKLSQYIFSLATEGKFFVTIKSDCRHDRKTQYSRINIIESDKLSKNIEQNNIGECCHSSNHKKSEELVFLEELFDKFHKYGTIISIRP
jgi:hypothetical protein